MNRGFTLIEVLVALTIAALALMAATRATSGLQQSAAELRERTLAQWSAENRLAQIRVQGEYPNVGQREFDCTQGRTVLRCREEVFATPNVVFRRVEISVFGADDHRRARLVGFATYLP